MTRPIPPGHEEIVQYPRPAHKEGHVMEPTPVAVQYVGEEACRSTHLTLSTPNPDLTARRRI